MVSESEDRARKVLVAYLEGRLDENALWFHLRQEYREMTKDRDQGRGYMYNWWAKFKDKIVIRDRVTGVTYWMVPFYELWWVDSYVHYRDHVGCGRFASVYRTLYWEIRGKEPKRWR